MELATGSEQFFLWLDVVVVFLQSSPPRGCMGRRRASDDEAAADMAAEASDLRFNTAHRKIGKTVFAAIALFTVGSVRRA